MPGHIFVPAPSWNLCETDDFGIPFDAESIWEFDPDTGHFREFASIPRELCGFITGMAFSPDGKRLRVASEFIGTIFEFDADGNRTVALDWHDGIATPEGSNCIAFDDAGNFYVANYGGLNILKFPAEGGPAEILDKYDPSDDANHVATPISLAVAPDQTVYVLDYWLSRLVQINPNGAVTVMPHCETCTGISSTTLAVDGEGTVFVFEGNDTQGGLYKYFQGELTPEFILDVVNEPICMIQTMNLSDDHSSLIVTGEPRPGQHGLCFASINPATGSYEKLPLDPLSNASPFGMAIVPLRGDIDGSGIVDLQDYAKLRVCLNGVNAGILLPVCSGSDLDADHDVDLIDFRFFQSAFGGPR